jgi:hypothetical protein
MSWPERPPSVHWSISSLIYDPGSGDGQLLVRLSRGIFRIASGAMPKSGFRVVTPVATIAILGTVFEVRVGGEGSVEVEPRLAGGGGHGRGNGNTHADL